MKKMSCFCASNTSGDSVYSGYLRWRMGLPLPPIPKDEESKVLKNTNKTILQDIDGVKNVNDFTITEDENDDQTLRRFRRRKREDSNKSEAEKTSNNNGSKHFRENPMYVSSTISNSKSTKFDSKLDYLVPSMFNESFIQNQQLPKTELISSLLHNRFFDSMQEYTDPYVPSTYASNDSTNLQKAMQTVVSSISDHTKYQSFSDVMISPPPPPPHAISMPVYSKRPSTIFEEDSNIEEDSVATDVSADLYVDNRFVKPANADNEVDESADMDRNTLTVEAGDNCQESSLLQETIDDTVTSNPIPIFSLKRGGLNRILTAGEYDYAYNKNWCKGVQLNLSLNLSEEKSVNVPTQVLVPSRKNSDDKSLEISSSNSSIASCISNNKENQLPLSTMSASPPLLWTGDGALLPSTTATMMTDQTDNSTVCGGMSNEASDSTATMNTTKALSLKLSSIEADALNDINELGDNRNDMVTSATKPSPPAPISPTKISRCSAMTTESEETNDSTSMKNESWDVIHGQFVKEITSTRFIDPSIINTNHPQTQPTSPFSILPPPPPLPSSNSGNQWIQPSHLVTPPTVASFLSHTQQLSSPASISKITSATKHAQAINQKHNSKHSKHRATKAQSTKPSFTNPALYNAATAAATSPLSNSYNSSQRFIINIDPTVPLENQRWYHFYLTRWQAEKLLQSYPDGSFLVRRSESNINDYSLSIKHKGQFLHMKITYGTGTGSNNNSNSSGNTGGFVLGEYSQPYNSIPHMLYHYCLTMVPVKGAEAACLKYAVTRN